MEVKERESQKSETGEKKTHMVGLGLGDGDGD